MAIRPLILNSGIGLTLLLGVSLDWQLFHGDVSGADDYHRHVRQVVEAMPYHSADWVSEDTPVPASAIAMLRPNVILSRRYKNLANGLEASFLLVQCLDARDLYGHYPPICYAANGYQMLEEVPVSYRADTTAIDGKMYTFSSASLAARGAIKVFDFMVLPNGRTAPDMAGVDAIARDRHIRHFGAAQIQIVTDAAMSDEDRGHVIEILLSQARNAIDAIHSGATP